MSSKEERRRKRVTSSSSLTDSSGIVKSPRKKKKKESKNETPETENFIDKIVNSSPQKSFEDDIDQLGREISTENYQVISLLGVGSQGRVYLVRLTSTDQYFALKVFRKDKVLPNDKVRNKNKIFFAFYFFLTCKY